MQKGTKTLIWIGVYGVVAYGIYWMVKNMHVTPRQKNIMLIKQSDFEGFDDGYIKAWADAVKSKQGEFTYQGKVYLTSNGRTKK